MTLRATHRYRDSKVPCTHVRITFTIDRHEIESAVVELMAEEEGPALTRANVENALRRLLMAHGAGAVMTVLDYVGDEEREQAEAKARELFPDFYGDSR